MQKKTLKHTMHNSSTQKIKAPEHLLRMQDYEDDGNESFSSHFQLPSLHKAKSWKEADNDMPSWDQNSVATSTSWSPEMEDIATWKLIQQWEIVQSTLYDDGEQVTQTPVLEECTHWRKQIPHLRITGKNPFYPTKDKLQDHNKNCDRTKHNSNSGNEYTFSQRSLSAKERKDSSKYKLQRTPEDDVFDIILEYVISELFPSKENGNDSLCNDLSEVLKISPAPVCSNKSSARSVKVNWLEETICLDNKFPDSKSRTAENSLASLKKEFTESQAMQKKYVNSIYGSKAQSSKGERDNALVTENKVHRPQTGRNKLGTVFKEKIVVSPVPYVLSTKESFSTLRTTPIKFMGQSLQLSTFQGSSRNIYFKNSAKSSTARRLSNCQSAWQAPVSPAVWPKNIKLAPIDTSRFPSSKNRSLAPSPAILQRNKKSLSPISHSALPASTQTVRRNGNEALEIQGKHIVPGESPKLSLPNSGWDYSPRIRKNKRKQSKEKV